MIPVAIVLEDVVDVEVELYTYYYINLVSACETDLPQAIAVCDLWQQWM